MKYEFGGPDDHSPGSEYIIMPSTLPGTAQDRLKRLSGGDDFIGVAVEISRRSTEIEGEVRMYEYFLEFLWW